MPGGKSFNLKRLSLQQLCVVAEELCALLTAENAAEASAVRLCPGNLYRTEDGRLAVKRSEAEKPNDEEISFMAPESFWNGETGERTAVYSVGMLLYYGASRGKLPLEDRYDSKEARGRRLSGMPFQAPEAAGSFVGGIVEKAGAFRPEDRYQSLAELAAALRCVADEKSVADVLGKQETALTEVELLLQGIRAKNAAGAELPPETEAEEAAAAAETGAQDTEASRPPDGDPSAAAEEAAQEPAKAAETETRTLKAGPELDSAAEEEALTLETGPEEMAAPAEEPAVPEPPASEAVPAERAEADTVLSPGDEPELYFPEAATASSGDLYYDFDNGAKPVYTRNLSRERELKRKLRRRRRRPVILTFLMCAALLLVAVSANAIRGRRTESPADVPVTASPAQEQVLETPAPVVTPTPEPAATPSPEPEIPHSYELYHEDVSWTEAKARCEAKGGHLVTISDENELQYIISLLEEDIGITKLWIGCHRENGALVWENGAEINYYLWAAGEPSYVDGGDGVSEDYILLWYHNYGWSYNDSRNDPIADYPAMYSGQVAYICEYGE